MGGSNWTSMPDLLEKRLDSAIVRWGGSQSEEIWITGGKRIGSNSGIVNSTEIWKGSATGWTPGPDLPLHVRRHCIVQLSDTRYLLTGGQSPDNLVRNETWIYDSENPTAGWVAQAKLSQFRYGHSCGAVTWTDGSVRAVVAAGNQVTTGNGR